MKFLFSLFAIVLLTESCNSTKETVNSSKQKEDMSQNVLSGTYDIEELASNHVLSQNLTITFDESSNKVSGFSGCNSFFGNYTIDGSTIAFGDMASSKKYCHGEKNTLERQFLEALGKVDAFKFNSNTVSFYSADNVVLKATKRVAVASRPSKSDVVKDNYKKVLITYQALSRATFKHIQVSETEIAISNDRDLKTISTYKNKAEDWKVLQKLLDNSDVENLDLLEVPTNKRTYDGAAHATLSVIKGDVKMMTPTFDHGTPPKKIEALVNKVLSIAENVTKQ